MSRSSQRLSTTTPALAVFIKSVLAACAVFTACSLAAGDDTDDRVKDTLSGTHAKQQFLAGERVAVSNANVVDDIFAAGKEVKFDNTSAKLIVAAAASLWLTNVTAEDLILAGGQIDLAGTVNDDVIAVACPVCPVGGQVRVTKSMHIGDDARLVGREVQVDGTVGGHLYAAGQRVELSSEVGGNAKIEAEHIVLAPGAVVDGNLRWAGPNAPDIRDGAVVKGEIVEVEPMFPFDKKLPSHSVWWYVLMGILAMLGILLALILLGVALQLAVPGLLASAAARATAEMWSSLGRGLVVALLGPALAGLLMASVIGVPIAMVAGAALVLLFALGFVAISYRIGLSVRRGSGKSDVVAGTGARILWTAFGIFILFIVGLVPFVGWAIDFLALIAGVGAVVGEVGPLLHRRGAAAR